MQFNSLAYMIFLVSVYLLYRLCGWRTQNVLLLAASYVFYAWWDVRFLLLIVSSTVVDYAVGLLLARGRITVRQRGVASLWLIGSAFLCATVQWSAVSLADRTVEWEAVFSDAFGWWVLGAVGALVALANLLLPLARSLEEGQRRKLLLLMSLGTNLGLLAFFKYFDFFVESAELLVASLGLEPSRFRLGLVLPVGISFYTFQTLSYTIDVYRGRIEPTQRFIDFALFVAFFPQLVAGPIERAARLLPVLGRARDLSLDQSIRGLHLILLGLFKKVAIADGVAATVDQIFAAAAPSWIEVIAGTALFGIQIYCDFAGYSDIARGSAKLFGIDLMTNFDLPYFSRNPREFWRRWHISLSTWLRDYLYIPLGGSRGSRAATYRNLMATMLLGGLWHGAAWNFVLWGLYHGGLLSLHRWTTTRSAPQSDAIAPSGWRAIPSMVLFLGATLYGWLLFRAESLAQIGELTAIALSDFGNLRFDAPLPRLSALLGIPLLFALELVEYRRGDVHFYRGLGALGQAALYAALLCVLILGSRNQPVGFIYFAF